MNVVKRSEIAPDYLYSVEKQAPAGNWSKVLGTNDWSTAESYAQFEADSKGKPWVRIVKEAE